MKQIFFTFAITLTILAISTGCDNQIIEDSPQVAAFSGSPGKVAVYWMEGGDTVDALISPMSLDHFDTQLSASSGDTIQAIANYNLSLNEVGAGHEAYTAVEEFIAGTYIEPETTIFSGTGENGCTYYISMHLGSILNAWKRCPHWAAINTPDGIR